MVKKSRNYFVLMGVMLIFVVALFACGKKGPLVRPHTDVSQTSIDAATAMDSSIIRSQIHLIISH